MATTKTYKRLGATTVTANTDTSLYTVPASSQTIVSSIVACNIGSTARTFRIAIVDGAIANVANEDYLYYDVTIPANDTFVVTAGFTLPTTYAILVRASHADIVFNAWGTEITTS